MPHYPSEIEFSDKYFDELFELGMFSFQKIFINLCLKVDYLRKRNGETRKLISFYIKVNETKFYK